MKQECSNREKILACAQRLFFEKGYDSVGVQEIVDTAGITKPTMYYYFKSKQGLLECLLEQGGHMMLEQLQPMLTQDGEYMQVLEQLTNAYIALVAKNREFYLMLVSLFSSAKDNEAFRMARPYVSKALGLLREFFERFSGRQGEFFSKAEYLAMSYIGSINMFVMVSFERGMLDNTDVREEFVKDICRQFSLNSNHNFRASALGVDVEEASLRRKKVNA